MNAGRFTPFLFRAISSILYGIVIVFYVYFLIFGTHQVNGIQQNFIEIWQLIFRNKWILVSIAFFIGEFFICIWEIFVLNTLFGIMMLEEKGTEESVECIFKQWFLFLCSIPVIGWLISIFFFLYKYFRLPVKNLEKFMSLKNWCLLLDKEKRKSPRFSIRDLLQFIESKERSFAFSELHFNFHRFWAGICCFFGSIPIIYWMSIYGRLIRLDFFDKFFVIIPSLVYILSFHFSIEYRIWSNLLIVENKSF